MTTAFVPPRPWRTRDVVWVVALSAALALTLGCGAEPLPAEPLPALLTPAEPTDEVRAQRGERVYHRYCVPCHGIRGNGAGPSTRLLSGTPPADFSRGEFKVGSGDPAQPPSATDLEPIIKGGARGTSMPAWDGVLDRTQMRDVALYVLTLAPSPQNARPSISVSLPAEAPTPTARSTADGRAVYLLAGCWSCHGVHGDGDGPRANTVFDGRGRLRPATALSSGQLRNGTEPLDIYRSLARGHRGASMTPPFGDDMELARPLVLYRAEQESALRELGVPARADQDALEGFVSTLPAAATFDRLTDEELEALVLGWRWDLVHYVHSLATSGQGWRTFLGRDGALPVYGGTD